MDNRPKVGDILLYDSELCSFVCKVLSLEQEDIEQIISKSIESYPPHYKQNISGYFVAEIIEIEYNENYEYSEGDVSAFYWESFGFSILAENIDFDELETDYDYGTGDLD